MAGERLGSLLKFLEETPKDPFLLYAIANEYRLESPERSKNYFEKLVKEHPQYLPAYYQAAQLHQELGELDEAAELYKAGIVVAAQQKDTKTLSELQSAYMNFQIEEGL